MSEVKNPTVYMLIGLPASGKSTWIENHKTEGDAVISSDAYIDAIAKQHNSTYRDVFKDHIDWAQKQSLKDVEDAVAGDKTIFWDNTNMSQKARMKKLKMVPDYYRKVAVVVSCTDQEEHQRRLNSRPGKTIPAHVMEMMANSYEYPVPGEGWDEVIEVTYGT